VNGNVKLGRTAARSGEWAQHFSNASCCIGNVNKNKNKRLYSTVNSKPLNPETFVPTARVLASQAEAIVDRKKTWPSLTSH